MNTLFFGFMDFSKLFCEYIRMKNQDYQNENIERKYLENIWNNPFLQVKNSLLELGKDFMELKDRKEKIKKEIEKTISQAVIV